MSSLTDVKKVLADAEQAEKAQKRKTRKDTAKQFSDEKGLSPLGQESMKKARHAARFRAGKGDNMVSAASSLPPKNAPKISAKKTKQDNSSNNDFIHVNRDAAKNHGAAAAGYAERKKKKTAYGRAKEAVSNTFGAVASWFNNKSGGRRTRRRSRRRTRRRSRRRTRRRVKHKKRIRPRTRRKRGRGRLGSRGMARAPTDTKIYNIDPQIENRLTTLESNQQIIIENQRNIQKKQKKNHPE